MPPRDAAAAGRVLAAWAADPARLPGLGDAAHARARASFSREHMVGRYDALFTSLLAPDQAAIERAASDSRDALGGEVGALDEARERAEAALGREADERDLRDARAERAIEHGPAVLDLDARAQLGRQHREARRG